MSLHVARFWRKDSVEVLVLQAEAQLGMELLPQMTVEQQQLFAARFWRKDSAEELVLQA